MQPMPSKNKPKRKSHRDVSGKNALGILKMAIFVLFILLVIEVSLRLMGQISVARQPKEDGAFVILALGESSTAGLWVEQNESYPAKLEAMLREAHPDRDIRVIVPMHMGQNTGHISNRIHQYLANYEPRMIILMAGYNNEWSLAESHIGTYVGGIDGLRLRVLSFLDNFRIYRVVRYVVTWMTSMGESPLAQGDYVFGGPEYARYPPEKWVYSLARIHGEEFRELWKSDMKIIIDAAQENDITVLLMTYHINPSYLAAEDFESLAAVEEVILVRNDIVFDQKKDDGSIDDLIFITDNWHPNEKGYSIIAQNAFDAIENNGLIGQ
jgi:lysophospholipase L1-like esterase